MRGAFGTVGEEEAAAVGGEMVVGGSGALVVERGKGAGEDGSAEIQMGQRRRIGTVGGFPGLEAGEDLVRMDTGMVFFQRKQPVAELGREPEEAGAEGELNKGGEVRPPITVPECTHHNGQQYAKDQQAGGCVKAEPIPGEKLIIALEVEKDVAGRGEGEQPAEEQDAGAGCGARGRHTNAGLPQY